MSPASRRLAPFIAPVVLLAFLLVAYLPLSSFQFALKNDAFLYNFPNKFFFSEALRNGIVPTWNPYLNFGFPIYADPGFAWWHPLTWLFGFIGYNAYTFTLEILTYIFIAGWGMYGLARTLHLSQTTALIAGTLFMCSGFFTGNLQHINFLTCAAFLPWLLSSWLKLQQAPCRRHLLLAALAGYFLYTGGHPAIPIGTIYFLPTFALAYWWHNRKNLNWKSLAAWNFAFCLLLLLMLLPPLLSWLKLMPFYARSEAVAQAGQTHLGFTLPSLVSFITPLPTAKAAYFFKTDVSMRNAYCSLAALLLFVLVLQQRKTPPVYKALVWAGTVGFLLSLGGPFKQAIFSHLPMLGYIRSNGQYRVFFILPIIAVAAYGIEKLAQQDAAFTNKFKKTTLPLAWASGLIALGCIVYAYPQNAYFKYEKGTTAKQLIDQAGPEIWLAAGMVWATCTLAMLHRWTRKRKPAALVLIVFIDLLVNTWAMLPITGVGKTSVQRMQQIYDHAPKGFPMPGHANKNGYKPTDEERMLAGDWSWFDKNPVKDSLISYPSGLKHTPDADSVVHNRKLQFCYLQKQAGSCNIAYFTPAKFGCYIYATQNDSLVILQNYYPGWHAFINGKNTLPLKSGKGFLVFPIPKGKSRIDVVFSPF